MLQTEFKSQVDNLMNILFGAGVASHATIIEQINYLVFLRSLSKKDDSAIVLDPAAERIFNGQLSKFHWDNLLLLNADALFTTLEEIFRQLPELATDKTIKLLYRDAHVKVFDKPTLRRLLHEIEKMMAGLEKEAVSGQTDIFGDMYEYLLGKMSQAGTLGSFRTPRHIIKFMVDIIDPVKGETVLDPACGTAGFLVAALEHIKEKYTSEEYKKEGRYPMDLLKPGERDFVYKNTFTGFDSDFDMFKFGLMNLYLHKLEHPNIKRQNTLVDTAGDRTKWDVILANPPFAGALDVDSISEDIRMGTRATEILFLRYMIDHLSPNGRAGVIVPEGVIFNNTNAHKKIRQMLVEDAGLWCVVSLPGGIFNPYAGVKTSILFFDKSLKDKAKDILFVKVENDGFDLGATKRKIDKNDLPMALEIINKFKINYLKEPDSALYHYVPVTTIINEGDYCLMGDKYKDKELNHSEHTVMKIKDVGNVVSGNGFPKDYQGVKDAKFPFIKVSDMNLADNEKYIKNFNNSVSEEVRNKLHAKAYSIGTVIFPKIGAAISTNKKRILTRETIFDNNVMGIIPSNRIIPEYLHYLLGVFNLSDWANDASPPSIRKSAVEETLIPVPNIATQKQMVEELDNYQKIIDGAQTVIDNWKPKIATNNKWNHFTLDEICTFEYGKSLPKTIRKNGVYPVMGSNGITGYHESYLIKGPAIIIGRKGSCGEVVWEDRNCYPIDTTYYVKLKNKLTNLKYLYFVLKGLNLQKLKGGAGVPGLNRTDAYKKIVYLPPLDEQEKIVDEIEKEKAVIAPLQELIKTYKEKINQKIREVWGSENIKT